LEYFAVNILWCFTITEFESEEQTTVEWKEKTDDDNQAAVWYPREWKGRTLCVEWCQCTIIPSVHDCCLCKT
jgi:hypothetical protein